jgi:hypothetical protein
MREVAARRLGEAVVLLGQAPHIVITQDVRAAAADPHLVIEDAPARVDHLQQPPHASFGLGFEIGAAAAEQRRVIAHRRQHQRDRERGRARELHVVAGVEPATLDVDRPAHPPEIPLQSFPSIVGYRIRHRSAVVQVGGLAIEDTRVDVGAVALPQVERQCVGDQRAVQRGRVVDPE